MNVEGSGVLSSCHLQGRLAPGSVHADGSGKASPLTWREAALWSSYRCDSAATVPSKSLLSHSPATALGQVTWPLFVPISSAKMGVMAVPA